MVMYHYYLILWQLFVHSYIWLQFYSFKEDKIVHLYYSYAQSTYHIGNIVGTHLLPVTHVLLRVICQPLFYPSINAQSLLLTAQLWYRLAIGIVQHCGYLLAILSDSNTSATGTENPLHRTPASLQCWECSTMKISGIMYSICVFSSLKPQQVCADIVFHPHTELMWK